MSQRLELRNKCRNLMDAMQAEPQPPELADILKIELLGGGFKHSAYEKMFRDFDAIKGRDAEVCDGYQAMITELIEVNRMIDHLKVVRSQYEQQHGALVWQQQNLPVLRFVTSTADKVMLHNTGTSIADNLDLDVAACVAFGLNRKQNQCDINLIMDIQTLQMLDPFHVYDIIVTHEMVHIMDGIRKGGKCRDVAEFSEQERRERYDIQVLDHQIAQEQYQLDAQGNPELMDALDNPTPRAHVELSKIYSQSITKEAHVSDFMSKLYDVDHDGGVWLAHNNWILKIKEALLAPDYPLSQCRAMAEQFLWGCPASLRTTFESTLKHFDNPLIAVRRSQYQLAVQDMKKFEQELTQHIQTLRTAQTA